MGNEFVEQQKELNSQLFGFAHNYLQTLVALGYAAIFFLWDKTEAIISPIWRGLAGLLIVISVGAFIAWEIFGFFFRQRMAMNMAFAAFDSPDLEALQQRQEKTLDELKFFLPKVRRIWYPAMMLIAIPICLAWTIILSAFAIQLIRLICHSAAA